MLTTDELERYDRQIMIGGFGAVIKYVAGLGKPLTNILLSYDALEMKFTEFKVKRDPKCAHCGHLASKE